MILSSGEIRNKIETSCKEAKFIWLVDQSYYVFENENELREILDKASITNEPFIQNKFDCDDFALLLHANVKRQGRELNGNSNYAFGETFVNKRSGIKEPHNLNICLVVDDTYLVEPQTNEFWKMDKKKDTPLLIKM